MSYHYQKLKERLTQPPHYTAMQTALQQLDRANLQHRLNRFERLALVRNLRLILAKSLADIRHTDPGIRARAVRTLNIQLNLPRFRFLAQIPQARAILIQQLQGTGVRFEGAEREVDRSQRLEVPAVSEALFETPELTRSQMAAYLKNIWNRTPLLRRLGSATRLQGQALHRELIAILTEFQRQTRITVQVVPAGTVQRLRGPNNLASLRSRPGFLQIEQPVFQNTATLLREIQHELAFHYTRGPNGVPVLTNTMFNALDLLDMMIQGNGRLPSPVA